MKKKLSTIITTLILATPIAALAGFGAVGIRGSSDPEGAKQTVEAMNFNDVTITGKGSVFSCDRGNYYRTKFSAVNVKGEKVDGVVCQPAKMFSSGASVKILNYKK